MPWGDGRRPGKVRGSDNRTWETIHGDLIPGHGVRREQPATISLALELSRARWMVAVHSPLTDKISLHQLKGGDSEGLLALIARLQARVPAALGPGVAMVSCYEAGYDGFWLHRLLVAHGVHNHVLDPASLQVNRRARRAKTDRIDAASLLRALLAHLRGEPKVISVVRVPSVEEEDARRLHRERHRLVGERVQHVNRIKGLCATQGVYDLQPLRRDRWQRLAGLRTGDGRALPPRLAAELARELKRLELVLEMIAALEAERDAIVAAPAPAHPHAPKIQVLARLKGIGPEFATVLVGEVFHRAFDNRRQVASYVGLAPSPFHSGGLAREQGISKAGNPKARTTMVELAWMWLRHQPESALSRWFQQRVGAAEGGCAGSPPRRSRASCWWRCGATSRPAWCPTAPCSRAEGEAPRPRRSPTSRGGCVTVPGPGCATAAVKMGPIHSEPAAPAAAWGTLVRGCAPTGYELRRSTRLTTKGSGLEIDRTRCSSMTTGYNPLDSPTPHMSPGMTSKGTFRLRRCTMRRAPAQARARICTSAACSASAGRAGSDGARQATKPSGRTSTAPLGPMP